jgi:hypothetical protein
MYFKHSNRAAQPGLRVRAMRTVRVIVILLRPALMRGGVARGCVVSQSSVVVSRGSLVDRCSQEQRVDDVARPAPPRGQLTTCLALSLSLPLLLGACLCLCVSRSPSLSLSPGRIHYDLLPGEEMAIPPAVNRSESLEMSCPHAAGGRNDRALLCSAPRPLCPPPLSPAAAPGWGLPHPPTQRAAGRCPRGALLTFARAGAQSTQSSPPGTGFVW